MSDKLSAFGGVWNRPARGIGVTTLWIVIVACFFPNLYLYFVHGAWPGWGAAFQAWLMIVSICGAVYFIEPISYFPVLGEVGIYIAFLTGNIGKRATSAICACPARRRRRKPSVPRAVRPRR